MRWDGIARFGFGLFFLFFFFFNFIPFLSFSFYFSFFFFFFFCRCGFVWAGLDWVELGWIVHSETKIKMKMNSTQLISPQLISPHLPLSFRKKMAQLAKRGNVSMYRCSSHPITTPLNLPQTPCCGAPPPFFFSFFFFVIRGFYIDRYRSRYVLSTLLYLLLESTAALCVVCYRDSAWWWIRWSKIVGLYLGTCC